MPYTHEYSTDTPSIPPTGEYQDYSQWGYTSGAEEAARLRQARERQAGRAERPTIGRDSRIDGGVYEGSYGGEAIVVDSEKYLAVNQAAEVIIARVSNPDGSIDKSRVLEEVFNHVRRTMRYDASRVNEIFSKELGGVDGTKIALDFYVEQGVGVCRHQALYAGAILEKLGDRGVIRGQASVDRNMIKRDKEDKYDGHAWVRYTNYSGEVFILDVAQGRLASLDRLMKERRELGERVWDYGRPEDHARVRGRIAVTTAETQRNWGRADGSTDLVRYDENGLIIIPDDIAKWTGSQNPEERSD